MELGWIFRHCVDVRRVGDGYLPVRFGDRMLDMYSGAGEATRVRAWDTAGVTMEFEVDGGTTFSFSYEADSYCRRHCVFDVYEGGVLAASVREPDESPRGSVSHLVGGEGRVRVRVHLPYCARVVVGRIDIPGAVAPVAPRGPRALFLGDSITQGMEVLHPSMSFPVVLGKSLGWDWVNQGVGGYVFDPASLGDVRALGVDHVLVAYGTNDFTRIAEGRDAMAALGERVDAYMRRLAAEAGDARVHVLTPLYREQGQASQGERDLLDRVRSMVAAAARDAGFDVIGGPSVSPHAAGFYVDGLHPNDAGAQYVAEAIARHLRGDGRP